MKASRWLSALAMVSMLALPAFAHAQEATPSTGGVERQILYEMTVSPDQMPQDFVKLHFDRHTMAPGTDITFGASDEGIRGRGFSLESGELLVTPLVASPVWWGDGLPGTEPLIVQPGEEVHLAAGDAMLVPAMDPMQFGPDDGIRIVNPGTVDAVFIHFHLHQQGGAFSSPVGYSFSAGAEYYDIDGLALVKADETLFRLTRLTAEPGTVLPLTEGAIVTFYQIDAGELTDTTSGAVTDEQSWPAGPIAGMVEYDPDVTHEVHVTGDTPAEVIELAVIPTAQDELSPTAGVEHTALFEITVPVEAMPSQLEKINFEEVRVAPGTDVVFPAYELFRGQALFIRSGELLIAPNVDTLVWRGAAALGGTPEIAEAGEPVSLAVGDIILLPGIPPDQIDPTDQLRIANPGAEETVAVGFHLHEDIGPMKSGFPAGVSSTDSSVAGAAELRRVSAGNTVFRMMLLTAQPGAKVPVAADAPFVGYRVEQGTIEWTMTGPSGEVTTPWPTGQGGWLLANPNLTHELLVTSDTPAVVLELAVIPSASAIPADDE